MGKYVCRKLRLCTWLLKHGFNYEQEVQDKFDPRFKVWLFPNSPELRLCVENYYHSEEFLNRN